MERAIQRMKVPLSTIQLMDLYRTTTAQVELREGAPDNKRVLRHLIKYVTDVKKYQPLTDFMSRPFRPGTTLDAKLEQFLMSVRAFNNKGGASSRQEQGPGETQTQTEQGSARRLRPGDKGGRGQQERVLLQPLWGPHQPLHAGLPTRGRVGPRDEVVVRETPRGTQEERPDLQRVAQGASDVRDDAPGHRGRRQGRNGLADGRRRRDDRARQAHGHGRRGPRQVERPRGPRPRSRRRRRRCSSWPRRPRRWR
jgi:hypothetical protein